MAKNKIEERLEALRKRLRENLTKKQHGKKEDAATLIKQIQELEAQLKA